MKNLKTLAIFVLVLCCLVSVPTFACDIQPMSDGSKDFAAYLYIGTTGQASCTTDVTARIHTYQIELVMSLYQVDGDKPDPLKSWTANGRGSISVSKNYYVTKGHDYQVTADITVKDSNGKFIESFPVSSAIVHY